MASEMGAAIASKAIDTAIQIGGSAINTAIANAYWRKNYQIQLAGAKELMDYENAYNTPSAQMERLQAAGLNPNLVYGSAAPAGQSGNASSPAGASPSGQSFNTPDIASILLQQAEARSQQSIAERNFAEANLLNKTAGRYDELVDMQLRKDNAEIRDLDIRYNLQASQIDLNNAHTYLAEAQRAYTDGQIGLQDYEKKRLAAQTLLFQSQTKKEGYLADSAKAQSVIDQLYAKYQQLFMTDGNMKEMSEAEYNAAKAEFERAAHVAAVQQSIEGSKGAQWTSWVFDQLGKLAGAGSKGAAGFHNVKSGMKMK